MQASHPQQYSQYEQRNAAFVPPSRIVHQPPRDLSPTQTPGMSPPMGMHQASQSEDLTPPQRPGAQNRQSTGFFSAFSRSKSASSGQILSPPATPGVNQVQHAPTPPEQPQQIHHHESSPPSRMLAASPSAATHSTGATPNPDASIGGHPAQPPPPPMSQQPLPKPEEPFALGPTGIPLHPELRSVLRLNSVHQQKIYFSGRLSKRVERGTDGTRPAKDEGWIDIWCQLGGVTLSIWNMQAIEEANARGEQVPPQYVNVTDAFVQVLGSVTFPATPTAPAKRYTNVLTLNTAGSNLLLFVCESPAALVSWAAALRLAAWEKSRLEEIYTAHLLRITLTESRVWKEPRTTLVKGQLEGWVRVRVAGQTDWKRFWVVISAGSSIQTPVTPGGAQSTLSLTRTNSQDSPTKPKKGRLSGLFSRNSHQHTSSTGSAGGNNVLTRTTTQVDAPNMLFFNSSKPKEKKNPVLSVWSVTQAFAVYPERPDLITRSTLVKIEGRLGREDGAGAIKGTEAWVLIMPEVENGQPAGPRKMLEWVVALHDAFRLYGRPQQYSFNPHNVASLMFAYPIEPNLEQLFLERELAESLDPRDDATSIVRSRLTAILQERIRNPLSRNAGPAPSPSPPSNQQQPLDALPPPPPNQPVSGAGRQPATGGRGPALTPITERSTTGETRAYTAGDSISPPNWSGHGSMNNTSAEASAGSGILAQGALVRSPIEEEDESRPLGALWGSINGATRDQNASAATRGARPMSMAFGASNIEGPAANGADNQAQPAPEQPVATDFASRGPAPALSLDPPSVASSTSGLAVNTQDHARPTSSYNPPAHSTMALGTGVPEPGSVDLRGIDVEHRLSPGNGHAYEGHSQNSPHGSTASEKPVLAPIRTTALSPPPRHAEPPAEKPAAAQSPAPPPVVPQQPLPQTSVPYHPPAQASPPRQPPAQATASLQPPTTLAKHNSLSSGEDFIPREAAKFILDHDEGASNHLGLSHSNVQAARAPVPGQRRTFESSSEDEGENEIVQEAVVQPWQNDPNTSPVPRQSTPMTFANMGASAKTEAEPPVQHEKPGPSQVYASSARASVSPPPAQPVTSLPSSSRPGSGFSAAGGRNLGRKPSGARAPPVKTPRVAKTALSQHPIPDDDEPQRVRALPSTPSPAPVPPVSAPPPPAPVQDDMADDLGVDALAALSFAERDHTQRPPTPPREQTRNVDNISRTPSPQPPAASPRPPRQAPSTLAPQAQQGPAFRSSFAPSKHAAERKAKAQAHQVASEDAMKRPGRANGKKPKGMATSRSGAWESSEEEDAQDQDEEGSDDEPFANRSGPPSVHAQTHVLAPQPQQQYRGGFLGSAHGSAADLHSNTPPNARPLPSPDAHPPQGRPLRGLPALPNQGGYNGSPDHFGQGRPSNNMYGPPSGPPSRAVSQAYDGYAEEQQQPTPPPSQQPYRGAYRQTIWNNNLDQTHRSTSPGQAQKDTFVQINPNETMTKAFTPQGLLQAGLQDKHDRSAKRQEELARESGASLLNVPNKPPPPQTGLLGAVTAHERDRKRDGGFGAVLTEREREKRLAEDRQRKIDDLQRQQLESQQSMYGGGMGMNPMMMNPMMTGMGGMPMGPMGGMGMMGFNPMMGAFDPQQQFQMWAAQQAAAEAYQRAMVSFSQAGSVAPGQGEEGGRVASPMPGQWGGMMGGMPGMMGMGGMGMGMNPMMGGMSPMMTGMGGMSGFGGSQFGAMGGMGMPNGMGMGGMGPQGGTGLNPNDQEDGPARQTASPSGNQR